MKQFIGDCVGGNPLPPEYSLEDVIDNATEIDADEFLNECEVDDKTKVGMYEFPNDYGFYKYQDIYFYTWSVIEHFYM